MGFFADPIHDFDSWDYIMGNLQMSILADRYGYLRELNQLGELNLSLHDLTANKWTKWKVFPGLLIKSETDAYRQTQSIITPAIDVHRSMLKNEIIVESDYPSYEENYDATRIIGKILEEKGFQPLYYFSGNKSIHVHIFFDWECLIKLDSLLMDQLKVKFKGSLGRFKNAFILWLRTKIISCWDTNTRQFDIDLIKSNHLIRSELSRNRQGFKTFLGYSYKDVSFVPYICNEINRIYPKLGEIRLSSPSNIQELIEEFIDYLENKKKKSRIKRRSASLSKWNIGGTEILRDCVKKILSDDFKQATDCHNRAFFILLNELKRILGDAQAQIIVKDWNAKMDFPIKEEDIKYRLKLKKNYTLSCAYIHGILEEAGLLFPKKRCRCY